MQQNPQLTSQSKFRLVESDPNDILFNPLNRSSAKMQYSIPKSKRWIQNKQLTQTVSKFYDLPEVKNKRSTSFGYGNKIDLSKNNLITPSPQNYTLKRQFQKNKKNGYTIGLGREMIKNVSVFNEKSFKIPGPGDYDIKTINIMQNTPKYSLKGKNSVDLTQKWIRSVPGPGNYSTLELIKNNNKIVSSSYQNSPAMVFSKQKRLSEHQIKGKTKIPGPGQYKIQDNHKFIEKFKSQGGKKFSKSQRKGIIPDSITPGPGAYKYFSDFIF